MPTPDTPPTAAREWPFNGYAPGDYDCRCVRCGEPFVGHKRATSCLPCAEKIRPPTFRHPNPHIINGEFQSDKYPTCPPGKVPLSVKDATAQDLLWTYAQRRRAVDAEFSAAVEIALTAHGYVPSPAEPPPDAAAGAFRRGAEAMREAAAKVCDAGRKPCACITKDGLPGHEFWQQNCHCSNSGDLADAQSWCSSQNAADQIRTLQIPEPPNAD